MYFLLVLDLLGIPQLINIQYPTNEAIMVVMFVIFSYIIGTLIQESASYLEKKLINLREKAESNYLTDTKEGHLSGEVLEKAKQIVQLKANGDINNITRGNCRDTFFELKTYLENHEKMGKANELDAMFAMSRDLFVCNLIIGLYLGINCICKRAINSIEIAFLIYTVVSLLILTGRAYRYAKMRVRTIIRQYISLTEEKTSIDNTAEENTSQPHDKLN